MRLRLVPFVPAAIALGGCYLYRDPAPLTPVLVAAALPRAAAIEDLDSLVAIIGEVHPNPGPRDVAVLGTPIRGRDRHRQRRRRRHGRPSPRGSPRSHRWPAD